jgi:DNA-binding LytR/AlgR family response regulator
MGQVEITAISDKKVYRLKLDDIYYFEVVDGHSFVYSRSTVFECRQKLYEFEELSRNSCFFRCSKSVVLNADKIRFIRPSVSGRFEATLQNEHKAIISRQYVPELKRILEL